MKEYLVKYETYDGNVLTKRVVAHDRESVHCALNNCKEMYWVRLSSCVPTMENMW
jgi:hypothetical protein